MWKPKPKTWRKYYWYRPPSLARLDSDRNRNIDSDYIAWLAGARGWTHAEARAHVAATQHPCGLVSSVQNGPVEYGTPQLSMF